MSARSRADQNLREQLAVNQPGSHTVYTPSPSRPAQPPSEPEPLPPVYHPEVARQLRPLNPLYLILLWIVLIGIIGFAYGWFTPSRSVLPIDTSIEGKPPIGASQDGATTALAIALSTISTDAPAVIAEQPTLEAAPAQATPTVEQAPIVGELPDDTLPWYILRHSMDDATFEEFNGALIALSAVPYQDLDTRGGADNKLCNIRTIYGSSLVRLWIPCWRIGK